MLRWCAEVLSGCLASCWKGLRVWNEEGTEEEVVTNRRRAEEALEQELHSESTDGSLVSGRQTAILS